MQNNYQALLDLLRPKEEEPMMSVEPQQPMSTQPQQVVEDVAPVVTTPPVTNIYLVIKTNRKIKYLWANVSIFKLNGFNLLPFYSCLKPNSKKKNTDKLHQPSASHLQEPN